MESTNPTSTTSAPRPSQATIPNAKSKRQMQRQKQQKRHPKSSSHSSAAASPTHSIDHQTLTSTSAITDPNDNSNTLTNFFQTFMSTWMSNHKPEQTTVTPVEPPKRVPTPRISNHHQTHGDRGLSRPRMNRRHSGASEGSSFDSGNETDHEAEESYTPSQMEHFSRIAYGSGDEQVSASGLVKCDYSSFGCEMMVQPPHDNIQDPHYRTAMEHHLSLLHAKYAVVTSQKNQVSILLEQEYRIREKIQRKLESKEMRYNKLKAAYNTKRNALKEIKQMQALPDLVSSYLLNPEQLESTKRIQELTNELAAAKDEIAQKNQLLAQTAELINAMTGQHSSFPAPQPSSSRSTNSSTASPSFGPTVMPPPPTFRPTKTMPQQSPFAKAHLQAQMEVQARAKRRAQANQQPIREPVTYYTPPHAALKSLGPIFNSQVLTRVFQATTAGPAPSSSSSASITTSSESVGAQLGLDKFCPVKRVNSKQKKNAANTTTNQPEDSD